MTLDISQFKAGDDVTDEFEPLKRRSGIVVSVRLNPTDADRLIDIAEGSGRTVSQVAREAIDAYLTGRARPAMSGSPVTMLTSIPMTIIQTGMLAFTDGNVVTSSELPQRAARSRSVARK